MDSPYLISSRLGDVIAAIQFLGQYVDYKLSIQEWNSKLGSRPRSVKENSWELVFEQHPEFFRKNDAGEICLVWRRAIKKSDEGVRAPLEPETISQLIDTAMRLHTLAVDDRRADLDHQRERTVGKRWWIQLCVSILTAALAFIGVILAASLKAGAN